MPQASGFAPPASAFLASSFVSPPSTIHQRPVDGLLLAVSKTHQTTTLIHSIYSGPCSITVAPWTARVRRHCRRRRRGAAARRPSQEHIAAAMHRTTQRCNLRAKQYHHTTTILAHDWIQKDIRTDSEGASVRRRVLYDAVGPRLVLGANTTAPVPTSTTRWNGPAMIANNSGHSYMTRDQL